MPTWLAGWLYIESVEIARQPWTSLTSWASTLQREMAGYLKTACKVKQMVTSGNEGYRWLAGTHTYCCGVRTPQHQPKQPTFGTAFWLHVFRPRHVDALFSG
jgi:hypothetical protein